MRKTSLDIILGQDLLELHPRYITRIGGLNLYKSVLNRDQHILSGSTHRLLSDENPEIKDFKFSSKD